MQDLVKKQASTALQGTKKGINCEAHDQNSQAFFCFWDKIVELGYGSSDSN